MHCIFFVVLNSLSPQTSNLWYLTHPMPAAPSDLETLVILLDTDDGVEEAEEFYLLYLHTLNSRYLADRTIARWPPLYFTGNCQHFTLLVSYSCTDSVQLKVPCKRMYLTQKMYQGMVISYDEEQPLPQEPVSQSIEYGPSLESTLSPKLILLLQRERVWNR